MHVNQRNVRDNRNRTSQLVTQPGYERRSVIQSQNIPVDTVSQYIQHREQLSAVTQPPQFRLEFRCDPSTGQLYEVKVPIQSQPAAAPQDQLIHKWRCNAQTGDIYKVLVRQQGTHHQQTPTQVTPQFSSQLQVNVPPVQNQVQVLTPQQVLSQQVEERVAGISPLIGDGVAKKVPKVIDYARRCPIRWAKTAKPENINLPLFVYGSVAEIESALSGRNESIPREVILAKLRHLKNILEICCTNCAATDFVQYGWVIARDYAFKVEDEVEQKFATWQGLEHGVRPQTLLMSQMEFPKPFVRGKVEKEPSKFEKRDRCTTFNTCTVNMKCDYEVANPGTTCNRKHECSWCRLNLKQGFRHQATNCQKKLAAGE